MYTDYGAPLIFFIFVYISCICHYGQSAMPLCMYVLIYVHTYAHTYVFISKNERPRPCHAPTVDTAPA